MAVRLDQHASDRVLFTRERRVILAAMVTTGMAFVDATALNVALPALQAQLNAAAKELLWIINAYGLLAAALLMAAGMIGDRWGRKRVYRAGISVFAIGSILCGLAPDAGFLIAARALQGLGAAFMIPGSLAMITATVPAERRGRAIGIWSAGSVVMTAVGPLLGGMFAQCGWWRGVFWINVPLAITAQIALSWGSSNDREDCAKGRIDLWGASWSVLALGGVNLGLIEAAQRGLTSRLVLGGLLAGGIGLIALVITEWRTPRPMLPLRLFRHRGLLVACTLTLLLYSGLYAMTVLLSLNLIQLQNYGEVTAGLAQLPIIVLVALLSPWVGRVADRYGPRGFLMIGPAVAGAGYLSLAVPGITSGPGDYWQWFLPPLVLLGVATGLTAVPLTATIVNSISSDRAGLAAALNSTLSRLSNVLGVAVLGPLTLLVFSHSLTEQATALPLTPAQRAALAVEARAFGNARPPAGLETSLESTVEDMIDVSLLQAFRVACLVCAGASGLGALLAVGMLRGYGVQGVERAIDRS